MEERFDGPGYNLGATTLAGLSGGTGFGGPWINFGNGTRTISPGLVFSDYPVSGNSINYAPSSTTVADRRDIGDSSIPLLGGELWMSYLSTYRLVGSHNGGVSMVTDGGNGVTIFSLQRGNGGPTNGLVGVDATLVSASGLSGDVVLTVAKFTNFGLGSAVTPQLGTFWALSDANYDAIKSGGITESELNANNLATATDSVTMPIAYTTTTNVVISDGSGASGNLTLDELRWGTDLQSVVAIVPEPGSAAMILGVLALLTVRRLTGSLKRVRRNLVRESIGP
jgi:hypothetical protein